MEVRMCNNCAYFTRKNVLSTYGECSNEDSPEMSPSMYDCCDEWSDEEE